MSKDGGDRHRPVAGACVPAPGNTSADASLDHKHDDGSAPLMQPAASRRNSRLWSNPTRVSTVTIATDRPLMSRAAAHCLRACWCIVPPIPSASATSSAARRDSPPANPRIRPHLWTQRRWVRRHGSDRSLASRSCSHSGLSGSAAVAAATKQGAVPAVIDPGRRPAGLQHVAAGSHWCDPLTPVRQKARRVHRERPAVACALHHLDREARPGDPLAKTVVARRAGLPFGSLGTPRDLAHRPQPARSIHCVRRADDGSAPLPRRLMAQWVLQGSRSCLKSRGLAT